VFPTFAQEATPEPTAAPVRLPPVDPLSFTGSIVIAGSSTVFPLTQRMAERFAQEGFAGRFVIQSIGTGAGLERFCVAGETDIANASRAIRQSEIDNCTRINRAPVEFRVGTDALVVAVSSENDFVDSLTLEQLGLIFSGQLTTWDAVDPSYPAEPILVYTPGTDSGTYDFFVEEALLGTDLFEDEDAATAAIIAMPNVRLSEDDNVLVRGVEDSPFAIGYFGFAYFLAEAGLLRAISIDAGEGAVEPTETTAEDGTYPLARPLFIYSDASVLLDKPQVAEFINFYLTNVNDEIIDVGYFPASADAINRARQNWLDAMSMS
jgi:phosphate binding protein